MSVCLSQSGEAWELVSDVAAGTHGWFELAGFTRLFASSLRKEAKCTVETQLPLHKHNIAKEPQKHGNAKKPAANCELAEYSGHNRAP